MPGHNDWYTLQDNPFSINFKPYNFKKMSFDDAADYTAKLISEKYNNIYIGLSGGLDSEYVANVFLRNKISFTPIIWKDPYSKESDFALYYCRKNNLKPFIIEKDLLDSVVYTSAKKAAKQFNSSDIVAAINVIIMKTVEKNNGYFLMSTGMPITAGETYPAPIDCNHTEFMKNEFYPELKELNHPGSFFCYTPELLHSYTKSLDYSLPIQEAKSKLYCIPFRPKIKPYHIGLIYKIENDSKKEVFDYGTIKDFLNYLENFTIV